MNGQKAPFGRKVECSRTTGRHGLLSLEEAHLHLELLRVADNRETATAAPLVREPANQLGLREEVPVHRAFEIRFPGIRL